ncbi:hypothetical protein BTVI_06146 [Pitangus sulphuratus]|nr:hypothetical protein BTVI_06146 [Pitangus sulphuratus]
MPARSSMDPPLAKAEPIRNDSNASIKKKKQCLLKKKKKIIVQLQRGVKEWLWWVPGIQPGNGIHTHPKLDDSKVVRGSLGHNLEAPIQTGGTQQQEPYEIQPGQIHSPVQRMER